MTLEPQDLNPLADRLRDILTDMGAMSMAPDQSARLIRETASAHPDLPPGLIASVVRQLESSARPPLVSASGQGTAAFARLRFGWRARITDVEDPRKALASARVGSPAVIAVDKRRDPWFARLLAMPDLSVIDDDLTGDARTPSVLVVTRQWSEPSGDDRTWWLTDAELTPMAVETRLAELGLAARHALSAGGVALFALSGYVQREDERLLQAPGRLTGVIGAVPLTAPAR